MIKGFSNSWFVYVWIFNFSIRPTSTTMTVTAYDGTGIVQQQPLTLVCNYTKGDTDHNTEFSWKHKDVVIVSGTVNTQTASFQTNTGWESGVFLGDYTSSLTIQLPASNVTPSIAGQYTCRVLSLTGGVQDTATATVQDSPQIESTFPSSRTVTEFSRLQIDCSSFTTPGNPPTTSYMWTYGGSTISFVAVLDINNIGRDRRGQYTCTASNTVGSDSETVSVDVQYIPQIESTFPSGRTVTEFSRLQIDCSSYTTPGNPPTTSYTWTYGGSTISSGAVLDINNIGRDRRGQYTCTASNTVGSYSETVSVDVQYLDRPNLTLDKTEVVENETVSLTCNVESNPTAELEIRNVDNNTVLVKRDTNRLQFTIDRVQCLHNGSSLCTARNTQIGDTSTSTRKELNVLCSPRQDFRQTLIQDVTCGLNNVASLAMNAIANPPPSFDWYLKNSGQLLPIPTTTEHKIVTSKQASVLQIQVENPRDYGHYAVVVENSIGKLETTFTVSPISLPKPPNEVTVENITSTSVTISWRSNNNGGATQTFSTEFRTMKGEWRLWSEGIIDPGEGKTQKSEIRSLQPGTHYEVLVLAQNPYGQSAKVVREVTTYNIVPDRCMQTPDRLGLGVGIGISVMVPVIVLIILVWCLFHRRESKNSKSASNVRNEIISQQDSATGDQRAYADLTVAESTLNEYEQLQALPAKSKVYQND